MIDHLTFSILTTSAWTRILTFITKTSLCQWTFGTHDAFWSTCRRSTDETTLARTNCMIVHHSADAVWTARRWCARLYPRLFDYMWSTKCEWISTGTRKTTAHGNMINYVTFCTGSTRALAWVHAIMVDTRLHSRTIRVHSAFWTTVRVWIAEII